MDKKVAGLFGFLAALASILLGYLIDITIYLILVLLAISGALLLFFILKDYLGEFKYKSLALKEMTSIFDDTFNIRHIIIINKQSGLCIFDQSYSKIRFDPYLISGFLQAISQFGAKFASDQELEELNYQTFKILLGIGNFIRTALILEKPPSKMLKRVMKNFISTFETKYFKDLSNFVGEVSVFSDTFSLIEKHFHISLTFPHRVLTQFDEMVLNPIERTLMEISRAISEEKGFFELKDLLTFATITNLGERNYIISFVANLIEREYFYPLLFMAPEIIWKERISKCEELISNAEEAFSNSQYANAAKYYEEAANIFNELGDIDKYLTYVQKAEGIRATELRLKKKIKRIVEVPKEEVIKIIPKLIVPIEKLGKLTEEENKFITLCDGTHSLSDISKSLNIHDLTFREMVRKFEKKGRIKIIRRIR